MFEHIFELDDESVTDEWIQMVNSMTAEDVRRAIEYLTKDVDDDGEPLGEEHEILGFESATVRNADDADHPSLISPHRVPGIVTKIQTENDDMDLARIYGSGEEGGTISGGYLALLEDVKGKSRANLIQDFALLDQNVVEHQGTGHHPWGDYLDDSSSYP